MIKSDAENLAQYVRSQPDFVIYETIDGNYNHIGAIINQKNEHRIIFLGDKIKGYTVKKISKHKVVLKKGKTKQVLVID